jgi:hypothetical protein
MASRVCLCDTSGNLCFSAHISSCHCCVSPSSVSSFRRRVAVNPVTHTNTHFLSPTPLLRCLKSMYLSMCVNTKRVWLDPWLLHALSSLGDSLELEASFFFKTMHVYLDLVCLRMFIWKRRLLVFSLFNLCCGVCVCLCVCVCVGCVRACVCVYLWACVRVRRTRGKRMSEWVLTKTNSWFLWLLLRSVPVPYLLNRLQHLLVNCPYLMQWQCEEWP